jgi:hypothetical protein
MPSAYLSHASMSESDPAASLTEVTSRFNDSTRWKFDASRSSAVPLRSRRVVTRKRRKLVPTVTSRDDFPTKVKLALAIRSGHRCCFPGCSQLTASPRSDDDAKYAIVGHAAHITAAAPGGPRYDPSMSSEERVSASNGAWMCNNHGTLVDRNDSEYPAETIRQWKSEHEQRIQEQVKLGIAADANAQKRMLQRVEAKIEEVRTMHRLIRNQLAFLETIDGHTAVSIGAPVDYVRRAAEVRREADDAAVAWRANIEWLVSALGALGRATAGDLREHPR